MTYEYNAAPYEQALLKIGIKLGEPFKRAKDHHQLICTHCGHIWIATPVSKIQAFKKHGSNGCPACNSVREANRKANLRRQNIQKLSDKGIEVLSDWDGRRIDDATNKQTVLCVRNKECGHVFKTTAINILSRPTSCTICGIKERSEKLTQTSYDRSEEWQKTASEWKIYKSNVTKLTKQNYKRHKDKINPNNLPTGRAGTPGAYHIDHIVPIRYCYNNNIPEHICAHPDNLQMLGWRENVGSRDKLKNEVPPIFEEYVK
jgi:hypothetical protein